MLAHRGDPDGEHGVIAASGDRCQRRLRRLLRRRPGDPADRHPRASRSTTRSSVSTGSRTCSPDWSTSPPGSIFVFAADVDWAVAGLIAVGSIVGGVLGARYGRRLSPTIAASADRRRRDRRDRPPDADLSAAQAGVIGLRRSEKRRSFDSASAKRRISSARRSSGSITASTTSSEARWRMSMSAEYSSRFARDEPLALGLVLDRLDLVEEDGVDRRLGAHHRDRGGRQRDAAVGLERRARPSRRGRRRRPCGRSPRASAPSPRRRR